MHRRHMISGVVLSIVAIGLVQIAVSHAQITKGKTRPAPTEYLMKGIMQPNCAALGAALKETPADDEAWEAAAINAAVLNEMGHLLMDDGRCPDGDWAGATKTLREQSQLALEMLEAKDAEGAGKAFQAMTKACAACHSKHKTE